MFEKSLTYCTWHKNVYFQHGVEPFLVGYLLIFCQFFFDKLSSLLARLHLAVDQFSDRKINQGYYSKLKNARDWGGIYRIGGSLIVSIEKQ